MQEQNYKNHPRLLWLWHVIIPFFILASIGFTVVNFIHSDRDAHDLHNLMPLIIIPIVMLFMWYYVRRFALIAQDRAIRAEESLRHFILTGKPIDKRLRMEQLIALRFASDEELPALVQKTIEQNYSPSQIKQAIKIWRADHHRV